MNNTALRAGAQSADNTHMVFADDEHEKFYYEKLEQARYQDCYHKALIYVLGISEDTRKHFSQIYDINGQPCPYQPCAGIHAETAFRSADETGNRGAPA